MNNRSLAFLLFFISSLSSLDLFGDTLKSFKIKTSNGEVEYALKEVGSIKFDDDRMFVNKKDGGRDDWNVVLVNSLTFAYDVSGETSMVSREMDFVKLDKDGCLSYSFAEDTPVRIYNVHGRVVDGFCCSGCGILNLEAYGKGVFLVYVAGRTFKMINR